MRTSVKRFFCALIAVSMLLLTSSCSVIFASSSDVLHTASPAVTENVLSPTAAPTEQAEPATTEQNDQGELLYEDANISIEYLRCENNNSLIVSDDGVSHAKYQDLILQVENRTDETLCLNFGFEDIAPGSNIYVDGVPLYGNDDCCYDYICLPAQPGTNELDLDCYLDNLTPSTISGGVYIYGYNTIDGYTANFTPLNLS